MLGEFTVVHPLVVPSVNELLAITLVKSTGVSGVALELCQSTMACFKLAAAASTSSTVAAGLL